MPETTSYLILGLIVFFGVLGFYALSLLMRFSQARKDIRVLQEIREK
jgi:hypothetical protein